MQKEIEAFEFFQDVHFEFIGSLKNNVTEYLVNFQDSCQQICNS